MGTPGPHITRNMSDLGDDGSNKVFLMLGVGLGVGLRVGLGLGLGVGLVSLSKYTLLEPFTDLGTPTLLALT